MQSLDLKIPPPAVGVLVGLAMWGVASISPLLDMSTPTRVAAGIAIVLAGGAFSLSGAVSFRRARTTINPMKPEAASALVSTGIYRFTRNPMYVGILLALVGWAVFLAAPWALLGPLAFCLYISRFQIAPEERALSKLFGAEYTAYQAKVRRWL